MDFANISSLPFLLLLKTHKQKLLHVDDITLPVDPNKEFLQLIRIKDIFTEHVYHLVFDFLLVQPIKTVISFMVFNWQAFRGS